MDLGGEKSSYQGYPYQVCWASITPANPDFSGPKMNCESGSSRLNSGVVTTNSFGCWEGNLGPESRVLDMNVGMHDGFLVNNLWNGIPCSDLLALADAAMINKTSGGRYNGGGGGGGAGNRGISEVNMQFGNQEIGCSFVPESQQYGQPQRTRHLFDLNSPPIVAEPQLITSIASPLKPVTPKQPRKAGRSKVVSDIINSSRYEIPDYVADKQDKSFDLDQQDLIIEQSQDAVWEFDIDEDFEEGSSDDLSLKKTPQPKQRRRKHRPKVVIEGQPKSAKKPTTPKPDGSSTGKRKYVRKIAANKSTATPVTDGRSEANDHTTIRQTRNSCRRKINFEEEQNWPTGVQSVMQPGQVTILESQALSPITPNKSEIKHVKQSRARAKRNINFSRETYDENASSVPNPSDSTYSTSNDEGEEERGSKRERSVNDDTLGIRYNSLESYLSMDTNSNNGSIPGLHFPVIYKKKRTRKCQSSITSRWSLDDNNCNFPAFRYEAPETSGFGLVEGFRRKRTKRLKRVRDLASFAGMIEGRSWKTVNRKRRTCMDALADIGVNIATKKRTKRNIFVPSSYYIHWFLRNHIGFRSSFRWKRTHEVNTLISQFENLGINNEKVERDRRALVPYLTRYQEKNAIVLYQQDRSIVSFEDSYNPEGRRKRRPKVDLDDETSRVWQLLLEDINSQGIDGTDDDNMKWWEDERNVFRGRAVSFIARMHLVQGDRRFSQWKGSVVDSVIGVFLTQNVSDHLSSSAFMSLAAKYPLKSKSTNEPLQGDKSSISVKESCQLDLEETITWNEGNSNQQPAQDHGSMTLQDADSYEEREVESSNEVCKTSPASVGLKDKSSIVDTSAIHDSDTFASFIKEHRGVDLGSSQNSNESISEDHTTAHGSGAMEDECFETREGRRKCASEQSVIHSNTLQSDEQDIFNCQTISEISTIISNQQTHENNHIVEKALGMENISEEILDVTESNIVENSLETAHKIVESTSEEHGNLQNTASGINKGSIEVKKGKSGKTKKKKTDWDSLRRNAQIKGKRERTPNTMDSVDYEAVRHADVNEIADTIKDRGMNNMLGERIKEFLNRLVRDHGSIDLEWLRDVPPDKTKEYLLSFRGLGLKSVECVRLLTLQHLAFPVDTNVGRIAVRLGWVPLQPLPESLQLHLLELYPVLESIQKYLWPRLCKLDQRTLYELHYQMITFGKVFCTKNKPNCNSCPMRGECRHFASAFASARLALPAPEEKSIVAAGENTTTVQNPTWFINKHHLTLPPANHDQQQQSEVQNQDPVVEEPATPEPIVEVPATPEPEKLQKEFDIEDFYEDHEEIPMIKLNMEAFTQNLQTYMENNTELAEGDMSRALVALTSEAASIPTPKLKNVSQLRTEHHVYELPDSHPLLEGLDKREPDDPCSYLLAIWTPGETAESIQPPGGQCSSQESGMLCNKETCFLCNSIREANSQTVRGTLLIPCRTAMRGSFPLNGTYFQVNEVFADHDSSLNPIDVPRSWLWNLPRRTVYFGTSIPTIFRGLTTEGIQYCFWRGFVCVRGFDQKTRAPRPLMARLHFPASKLKRSRGKIDEI